MTFLVSRYDGPLVALSIAIACFASYVALDLAGRMRGAPGGLTRVGWIGGSIALGTGIWAIHFVGMLAFSIPIAIGYRPALTGLSWAAACGVSALALAIASRATLGWRRLAAGATTMGAGIFAMHYIGLSLIHISEPTSRTPISY